jgi:hypothetical protein
MPYTITVPVTTRHTVRLSDTETHDIAIETLLRSIKLTEGCWLSTDGKHIMVETPTPHGEVNAIYRDATEIDRHIFSTINHLQTVRRQANEDAPLSYEQLEAKVKLLESRLNNDSKVNALLEPR